MRTPLKSALLFIASLIALVLGGVAWKQYRQIVALTEKLHTLEAESAGKEKAAKDLWARLAEAEKKGSDAQAEADRLRSTQSAATTATPATTGARNTGRPRDPMAGMAALDNPNVQRMMASAARNGLDQRYGSLFRRLKLSPEQLAKLKDMLTERQMSAMDVMRAAQTQGLNPMTNPEEFGSLLQKAQQDIDENVRALIGDEGYGQYQDFNQNIGAYGLLDQIGQRLSYTSTPLSDAESDAVLKVIEQTTKAPPGPPGMTAFAQAFSGMNPMTNMMTQPVITDETIQVAQQTLTPAQVAVIQQLKEEQDQQRANFQSMARGAGTQPATPPPTP